jgi:hypothetical protein
MIGNDDVGLEQVAAVVAIEVNSRVRWDARQIWLNFTTLNSDKYGLPFLFFI